MGAGLLDEPGGERAFIRGAIGVYLAGGPVVHLLHGRGGRAALSLVLRLSLPALGYAIGSGGCYNECINVGGLLLGTAGVVGAVVADAWIASAPYTVIKTTSDPSQANGARPARFSFKGGGFAPAWGGATMSLFGTF